MAVSGKNAGQHLHAASLMKRLNRIGIPTRAGRNAALMHIAATTPPAVFANLLGLDISTATRWTAVGGSWMTYAAERQNPRHAHAPAPATPEAAAVGQWLGVRLRRQPGTAVGMECYAPIATIAAVCRGGA